MTQIKKWTDESVATLTSIVSGENPVSAATVEKAAAALETSVRSVAAKLRSLKVAVASMAKEKVAAFTPEDTEALRSFVTSNAGQLTYAEISAGFAGGKYSPKVIQGKLLSLELHGSVKPTPKVETVKTYTDAEQAKFVDMVKGGAFVEDIAAALNKTIAQVRGKALSLLRSGDIVKVPALKESHATAKADALEGLDVSVLTVAEIVAKSGKTERGVKTMLTKRGIDAADYKGSAKKAKAAEAKAAA